MKMKCLCGCQADPGSTIILGDLHLSVIIPAFNLEPFQNDSVIRSAPVGSVTLGLMIQSSA